jgi:hypothetical protein
MATRKLTLPPALGSYCNLFVPRVVPGSSDQTPKYSLALLFDKAKDKEALAPLKKMIIEAATEKFGPKALEMFKSKKLASPLNDGDIEKPDDDLYEGKVYINAKATRTPVIVDRKRQAIIDDEEAYSGCTFVANVSVYAYDKAGNKGVGIGLNGVQVIAKGERIDGKIDPEKEFKDFSEVDGTPPASAPADSSDDLLT